MKWLKNQINFPQITVIISIEEIETLIVAGKGSYLTCRRSQQKAVSSYREVLGCKQKRTPKARRGTQKSRNARSTF
jgi:hypothetical protein